MSSRIEQLIDEIEEYIDGCKYQPLSNSKIIVNKEEIDELLRELRMKTPDEIKRYQKIISNKEAILSDARAKAEALINDATMHTNELINEHEIMQQAYSQANDVVKMATQQAQEILDNATIEANNMRMAAMQYTDDILANVENLISQAMRTTTDHYESFFGALNHYSDVVNANRIELNPPEADEYSGIAEDTPKEVSTDTGSINLDLIK
ncbi:MAG: vacuolar family H+-ATPase subunit H [Lachnospiraceae bacterium]|jgi:cell division septum initiation protein DivIVA|nr:vacuolar family H+-ATPase subunit H [Lachnospiraceae bacterium]MCI9094868.1 vacuolar family H+-ATPase subunit H [Lachnospiraceae bacterium]MCI9202803.1 vacuolar family H+-ATPase subunit H [Lachnospiraceae bacterium]